MRFNGSFVINAPAEKVWDVATKPDKFAKAIPDLKSLKIVDETTFAADFSIKLGPLGGVMKMNFKYVDMNPPRHVSITGRGSGLQSTVDLKISLDVSEEDQASKVDWTADLTVGGLVASVGGRLIEGVTKDKINEIINNLRKIIEKEAKS